MNKIQELAPHIAYCGLDCSGCEVYQATAFDDDGLRQNYANKVKLQWKIEVDPASVNCHGCRDTRPKSGFCASCEVRQCAAERGLENCAPCEDYGCEKLQKVHAAMINVGKAVDGIATASINLDTIRNDMGLT
ncbi:MAG: DUF3795 domain-containing protein [Gammaproteobacteria bacterium]|jgi:hypothetical protein|nr:hypothetical protein [Chromatiales bacterium]MDP6674358.1 DUF3795 domain-containing protein [Gammaproteobacteria bacterium]